MAVSLDCLVAVFGARAIPKIRWGGSQHVKPTSSAAGIALSKNEIAVTEVVQEQLATEPSVDEIRQRAYELYLEGGRVDGRDVDHWLQAERQIAERIRNRY
jgi:hypothetical protein